MKTSRISAAVVTTLAMFAADLASAAPTATGGTGDGTGGGKTVVLNSYSKVWVTGDNKGPEKLGKNTGAGTMDAAFSWDDLSYKADKTKVNLLTVYTRSDDTPNGNNSFMQGGFALATLTAKGVVPGAEVKLPKLNGERTFMRPEGGFLPGNRVLLMAASEDNGVNNNPQPVAFVVDATTGAVLGIPNNTRGPNNLNKPTNIVQTALKDGIQVQNPNDQRGPHNITRVNENTFVVGMQYNNQAQEGYSISVQPDNSVKINWLKRFSNNAQHCRPQVQIAPGATVGYIASVEANNQPADIGFRVSQFDVATGKALNTNIAVRSEPKNGKYVAEPVMGLLGDKLAITYAISTAARKGGDPNNNNGHTGGLQVNVATLINQANLQVVGSPIVGVGTYGRHGGSFVTGYGPKGEPSLAVISGSSTGTGGGFIQMFPMKADGTYGAKDAAKVYPVSPFSDVANVQAQGKRNPNNQARGFINGLGDVPNPGFTVDPAVAATNFMPETKTFSFSTVTGYSGPEAKTRGLKNSIWLSLVPASWAEGITTIPGKTTDLPGSNPDGTGPSPTSTAPGTNTDANSTSAEDDDVVKDENTSPSPKKRNTSDTGQDGCSVSHGSSSNSFGLIGLALAGVLVAARRRNRKEA